MSLYPVVHVDFEISFGNNLLGEWSSYCCSLNEYDVGLVDVYLHHILI